MSRQPKTIARTSQGLRDILFDELAVLRAGLRARLLASPLGDAPRYVRNLENANSRVVGVVMTMLPRKGPDAFGGAQYGYYGSEDEELAPSKRSRQLR